MGNEINKMDWLKYMRFRPGTTDSDTVYKRLWTRIEENSPSDHPEIKVKTRKLSWLYKIAAVLLLFLGLSGLYFLSPEFSHEEMIVLNSGSKNIRTVELSDGTIVKMGSNSIFTYPKQFKKNVRRVKVNGQCFFQVKKDTEKPFIIQTENMEVTVLGTQFEVFSYEQENMAEVTLLSGKVEVKTSSDSQKEKHTITLDPDQKARLNKTDGSIYVEEVDASKYLSWQESGMLSFENERLSVIIPRLEHWFGCKIVYPDTESDSLRITIKVRTETIDEVLHIISLSTRYKYKQQEQTNTYELY